MKKTIFILTITAFLFSCNNYKDKRNTKNKDLSELNEIKENKDNNVVKTSNSYLIAFYNVENLFDTINDAKTDDDEFTPEGFKKWNKERYNLKLNKLSWVLSNLNDELPTIIGLSEVENEQVVKELAKTGKLAEGNYKVVHEDSPDTRGIDVALMYRSNLFEYISHESIKVVVPSAPESKLRDILYVKGKFAKSNIIHIFVNHWKSRLGGREETEFKRIATAKILKNKINEIFAENKDAKIIIMGDMNDEPKNKSLSNVLFAKNHKQSSKSDELYNLLYDKSLKGEGTNSRNYKWFMLDNLIVSQSLADDTDFYVDKDGGQIFKDDKILYYNAKANFKVPNKTYGGKNYYGGYSDHLAVYFVLKR